MKWKKKIMSMKIIMNYNDKINDIRLLIMINAKSCIHSKFHFFFFNSHTTSQRKTEARKSGRTFIITKML